MKPQIFALVFLPKIGDAILRNTGDPFVNTFFPPPQLEFYPTYQIFPPVAPYFQAQTPSMKPQFLPREPKLLTPDIEQYEGERYFKAQRRWNHLLNVNALIGYSEHLSDQAVAYTAAANQMSRTPQERHYGVFGNPRPPGSPPMYRYTQVGVSYGHRKDFHQKMEVTVLTTRMGF